MNPIAKFLHQRRRALAREQTRIRLSKTTHLEELYRELSQQFPKLSVPSVRSLSDLGSDLAWRELRRKRRSNSFALLCVMPSAIAFGLLGIQGWVLSVSLMPSVVDSLELTEASRLVLLSCLACVFFAAPIALEWWCIPLPNRHKTSYERGRANGLRSIKVYIAWLTAGPLGMATLVMAASILAYGELTASMSQMAALCLVFGILAPCWTMVLFALAYVFSLSAGRKNWQDEVHMRAAVVNHLLVGLSSIQEWKQEQTLRSVHFHRLDGHIADCATLVRRMNLGGSMWGPSHDWASARTSLIADHFEAMRSWLAIPLPSTVDAIEDRFVFYLNSFAQINLAHLPGADGSVAPEWPSGSARASNLHKLASLASVFALAAVPPMLVALLYSWLSLPFPGELRPLAIGVAVFWAAACFLTYLDRMAPEIRELAFAFLRRGKPAE